MSWFDDLRARVEQSVDQGLKDINSYIATRAVDEVVKVASAQNGNLSEAQIRSGQYGGPQAIAAPTAPAADTQNAQQASQIAMKAAVNYGPLLLAGVAAYFLFSGKKSRG